MFLTRIYKVLWLVKHKLLHMGSEKFPPFLPTGFGNYAFCLSEIGERRSGNLGFESLRSHASVGPVEELDGVDGSHRHSAAAEPSGDLQEAAWIARDHDLRLGLGQPIQLSIQEV